MNWKKIVSIVSLGLAAAATMPASHAQEVASATMTGFAYTLIDLNPGDGIAPGLTLSNQSSWVTSIAIRNWSPYPELSNVINSPGSTNVANSSGWTTATYVAPTALAITQVNGASPYFYLSSAQTQWDFALTPHTAAVIMGYGSISSEDTSTAFTNSVAQIFASYMPNPTEPYENYLSDSLYPIDGKQQSRVLNVTFMSGDSELDGRLGFGVSATGMSFALPVPTPVPEPETYAMFLGGLAVVGFARRRAKA